MSNNINFYIAVDAMGGDGSPDKVINGSRLFLDSNNGVKLIEYNARFGDPEALNLLTLLETDFSMICHDIVNGSLSSVQFKKEASVCKYIVPQGYGSNPKKNVTLEINPEYSKSSSLISNGTASSITTASFTISSIALSHSGCMAIVRYRETKSPSDLDVPSRSTYVPYTPPAATSTAPSSCAGGTNVFIVSESFSSLVLDIVKPNNSTAIYHTFPE